MTDPTYTAPYVPQPAPTKPPKKKVTISRGLLIGLIIAIVVLFIFAISGRGVSQEPAAAPVTITETETETETVEVATVPQACLTALDDADAGFGIAAETMGIMVDALNAAAAYDTYGVNDATTRLTDANARLAPVSDSYNSNKAICRAAGE